MAPVAADGVKQRGHSRHGATPRPDSPEDYAAEIARDRVLWGGIVRKLGLRVE